MKKQLGLSALLALALMWFTPALAQVSDMRALVVSSCGTVPLAYKPSTSSLLSYGPPTVDVNGNWCGTGGGGGGGSVTITGPLGAQALGASVATNLSGSTLAAGSSASAGLPIQGMAGMYPLLVNGTVTFASSAAGPTALSPTITVGAYTQYTSLGGLQAFTAAFLNKSGVVTGVQVSADQSTGSVNTTYANVQIGWMLFTASPASTCTDHATFVWNTADRAILVPGSPFVTTLVQSTLSGTAGSAYYGSVAANAAAGNPTTPSNTLWACPVIVSSTVPTPTVATGVTYSLAVLQ